MHLSPLCQSKADEFWPIIDLHLQQIPQLATMRSSTLTTSRVEISGRSLSPVPRG